MKIYTSYFAVANKLPDNVTPVSIAKWMPKGCNFMEYKKAAPTEKILRDWKDGKITPEQYIKAYQRDVLKKLTVEEVKVFFEIVGGGYDIALLCFEKSDDFCHRHLFAEWLVENGFEVEEFDWNKEV